MSRELRGYGVDPTADRLSQAKLRSAKLRIRANRKKGPQVYRTQAYCNNVRNDNSSGSLQNMASLLLVLFNDA